MRDEPTGDVLLAELGALAREERADPRLEALAEGRLSAAERADLLAAAATDPELAAAIEAFTPLDEAARDRIANHLLSQVIPKSSAALEPGGKVLAFRRPMRVLLAVVPLAAAAALAFFLLRPGPVGEPVPGYGLTVEGGEKPMRSTDPVGGPPRLLPDSRLRLVLTPAAAATGTIAVRGWKIRDGQAHPWPVTPRIAPNGAALIEGTAQSLGLNDAPGRVTLVVAVGREAALPPVEAVADLLTPATAEDAPFRLLTTEVELLPP